MKKKKKVIDVCEDCSKKYTSIVCPYCKTLYDEDNKEKDLELRVRVIVDTLMELEKRIEVLENETKKRSN